jgi:hypothetical protein
MSIIFISINGPVFLDLLGVLEDVEGTAGGIEDGFHAVGEVPGREKGNSVT